MKTLFINFSDDPTSAGSTAAMLTLADALKVDGVTSRFLCAYKSTGRSDVHAMPPLTRFEHLLRFSTRRLGLNDIHRLGSYSISDLEAYREADVLQFYTIHSGTISYLALPRLTRNKPAVFVLVDPWAMTGHCGIFFDCQRWRTGCGRCPNLKTNPAVRRDATHIEWKLKRWVWQRTPMHFVAPSRWMKEQAKQSMLLEHPVHHIPHGIDTDIYSPIDSEQARDLLNIPIGRKVLLTVATDLNRPAKGMDLLIKALSNLNEKLKSEVLLLTIGRNGNELVNSCGIEGIPLGVVSSPRLKALCYSAADVYVLPSRIDNAPIVVTESLSCGTPVVAFDVGGVSDQVRPGVTGFLAEPENILDLRDKISLLLQDSALRTSMADQCRLIAVSEFDRQTEAARYKELYAQLLIQHKHDTHAPIKISKV